MVTPIRVMPLMGDQLVRPMHSERITPAIQIHSVPTRAMRMPRSQAHPLDGVDRHDRQHDHRRRDAEVQEPDRHLVARTGPSGSGRRSACCGRR